MIVSDLNKWAQRIFHIRDLGQFNELAIELYYIQYKNNSVYRNYCNLLGKDISGIQSYMEIPFLPVELFKTHRITSVSGNPEFEFRSSGTTYGTRSTHLVFNSALYRESISNGFRYFYGDPSSCCFIILIPSPTEQPQSSLSYMAALLINESGHPDSGFYMGRESMIPDLVCRNGDRKLFVFGLSYALADIASQNVVNLSDAIVMETGGMKGRSKELTREELHSMLCHGLNIHRVHSEYSMCELFSQAYSKSDGRFSCPPWMKILVRETNDPFTFLEPGKAGGINIIDLANICTCPFIATQDLGKIYGNGEFEVLGRFDSSDLRGCSLML
jgi:hypothetical protein